MKRALTAVILVGLAYIVGAAPAVAGTTKSAPPDAPRLTPRDQHRIAQTHAKAGRDKEAGAAYRDAIAHATDDSLRLESTRGVIRIELKLGDYRAIARTLIRAELAISDQSMASQVIYPTDLKPAQQRSLADALESAISGRKGLPITRLLLADLLIQLNEFERARPVLAGVRGDVANDPTLLRYVCQVSRVEAFMDQAIEIARQLIEIEPENPLNSVNLAETYGSAGMAKEAVDQADFTLKKWPNDTWAARRLPDVYVRFKAWDKAIDALNHSIELIPDSADSSRLRLAETYETAGRPAEARALYEMLLATTNNSVIKSLCRERLPNLSGASGKAGDRR